VIEPGQALACQPDKFTVNLHRDDPPGRLGDHRSKAPRAGTDFQDTVGRAKLGGIGQLPHQITVDQEVLAVAAARRDPRLIEHSAQGRFRLERGVL